MSHRQYQMLLHFRNNKQITVDEALFLNQNTFGSLCFRHWVIYTFNKKSDGGYFTLSKEGNMVLDFYQAWHGNRQHGIDFSRKVNSLIRSGIRKVS